MTRFIYLTFVSTPLQCFQCFYMSLMFFQSDFWCLMFFCDVLTFLISLYFHQLQCFHSSNTAAETETSLLKFFHNKHTLKLNCFSVICVVVGKFSGKDLVLLCYPPSPPPTLPCETLALMQILSNGQSPLPAMWSETDN